MLRTLVERFLGCIPGSCCTRPDVGAPLWTAPTILATYESEQQQFLFSKSLGLYKSEMQDHLTKATSVRELN